ncbi:cytochrome ubiquinol oxidase subunit I [Corynebacterium pollutisoli]|uniref:SLAC1 family transporter n=1 Tax=Corynebacterium pollutisoli TaxID=1610489 RepID=UPI0030845D73
MDLVDVSRWQFGITTVYHFIFVPLTIGLAPLVAAMQTAWHVTGREHWYRATRFFGTLFLINFAMGVVTGIVQEFQFGMNWSEYSRFVGDVFGAPLALEGLAAFLAPPSVVALSWQSLTGSLADPVGIVPHATAVFFALLLLTQVPRLMRLPFSLPILAYTFPVATVATVTVAMAGATGSGFHTALGIIALVAATGIVLGAVGRVAWAAAQGQIFRPE